MFATIRRAGPAALLLLAAGTARADLWVDCANGDDADSGEDVSAPLRTINEAMRRLDSEPQTVHVAAGTCPSEGGVRLRAQVTLRCAGAERTRIDDVVHFGSQAYAEDWERPHEITVEDCAFLGGTADEAMPPFFGRYRVTLRRTSAGPGLLRLDETGFDATPIVTVEDSTLDNLGMGVFASGLDLKLRRSSVAGVVDLFAASDSRLLLEDGRIAQLKLLGYLEAWIDRTRFAAASGTAVEVLGIGAPPVVRVSSSVFTGYDCGVCGWNLNLMEVENSTFVGMREHAVFFPASAVQRGPLRLDGNVFQGMPGDAVSLGAVPYGSAVRRNVFDDVAHGVLCTATGPCLPFVDDLNAQGFASENLDVDPAFADPASGDYHLTADSPLIDRAQAATEVLLQPMDLDGVTRPVDGDLDGEARSDIGAFEYRDEDGDGVADYRDRCPGSGTVEAVDLDGCSIAQRCPCEGPWEGHGDYVACVKRTAEEFEAAGWIGSKEKGRIVRQAAHANCGKAEARTPNTNGRSPDRPLGESLEWRSRRGSNPRPPE